MRRVTRQGGSVAGLVNDFRCGFTAFSLVLDTAAPIEPTAGVLRDEFMSDRKGWTDGLAALFRDAGLAAVRWTALRVLRVRVICGLLGHLHQWTRPRRPLADGPCAKPARRHRAPCPAGLPLWYARWPTYLLYSVLGSPRDGPRAEWVSDVLANNAFARTGGSRSLSTAGRPERYPS